MMFQIAAARAFAIDAGVDCSFPNLKDNLRYIDEHKVTAPYGWPRTYGVESNVLLGSLRTDPASNAGYEGFPFHYEPKSVKPNTVIDGFFQSEKYFVRHRQAVLDLFDFSFVSDKFLNDKYPFLKTKRVTSIHVRRGDYVIKPECHPPQTVEYYKKAMDLLRDKTDLFLVSTDDVEWCKDNLAADNVMIIDDEKDYIELYVMSLCDNNIICNSSYGWWGAWLNRHENKIVIGPQLWFGPTLAAHDTSDILPSSWIKV